MSILKKILPIAGVVAGLSLMPIAANAQSTDGQSQPEKKDCNKDRKGKKGHKGHSKAFKKALKSANVDDATQANIKTVFERYKPQMKALRQEVKQAHQSGDPLQVQAARLRADEKRLEMMSDVRAQMSDAQWTSVNAKLKEMRKDRKNKRKSKRDQSS